jgi:hypothetical protein
MASKSKRKRRAKTPAPETPEQAMQRQADERYAKLHPQRALQEAMLRNDYVLAMARFGHKRNGTTATHDGARRIRQGALARLHTSGAISNDQLGWALEIAAEHERIDAEVAVRSASLETRIDGGRARDDVFEAIGRVRRAVAYTRWRAGLIELCRDASRLTAASSAASALLDMIVDDLGVTWAARRLRISVKRMRKLLEDALDLWPKMLKSARDDVDRADLMRIEARLAA